MIELLDRTVVLLRAVKMEVFAVGSKVIGPVADKVDVAVAREGLVIIWVVVEVVVVVVVFAAVAFAGIADQSIVTALFFRA